MTSARKVAEKLNLAKSTVSHALNGHPGKMSEETRQRILRTAAEMGYIPNPAARALNATRSGHVGLVAGSGGAALSPTLLLALAAAVDETGGNLLTCITARTPTPAEQDRLLHTGAVDGLFLLPEALSLPGNSAWMKRPHVFLFGRWEERRAASIRWDDRGGVRQVNAHLWVVGHRRLAYLHTTAPAHEAASRERLDLLRRSWIALGGSASDIAPIPCPAAPDEAASALKPLLDGPHPPTALFGWSSLEAAAALAALPRLRRQVPTDVSVVGWDDTAPSSLTPTLTAVHGDPAAFARAAVELLQQQLNRPPDEAPPQLPTQIRVPVELLIRETTARPPRP